MEKRRRARINTSLAQLKTLVLDTVKGDVSSVSTHQYNLKRTSTYRVLTLNKTVR